jgi:hypothetical protein
MSLTWQHVPALKSHQANLWVRKCEMFSQFIFLYPQISLIDDEGLKPEHGDKVTGTLFYE